MVEIALGGRRSREESSESSRSAEWSESPGLGQALIVLTTMMWVADECWGLGYMGV